MSHGLRSSRWLGAALRLLAIVQLAGCGPITYRSEIRRASDAVEAARAAQAEQYAVYWWTRANEYLHKARELAGYADYAAANRYGKLAAEAANLAEQQASGDKPQKPTTAAPARPKAPPAKGVAPAKDKP